MGDAAFRHIRTSFFRLRGQREDRFSYAIRLQSKAVVQKQMDPLLTRPLGFPSRARSNIVFGKYLRINADSCTGR